MTGTRVTIRIRKRSRRRGLAVGAEMATWPAHQLAEAVRTKQVSSRELLDLFLDRIDRLNGPVNAVVTLDADRARRGAAAADHAAAPGGFSGPLPGPPITP